MKRDYKKIIQIVSFPFVVFVYNQLVNMRFDLYLSFPWLDVPMHLIGGASIGVSASLLLRYQWERPDWTRVNRFFFLWNIGMVSFAAIVWEFYEFTSDYFFHTTMQASPADTVADMFLGLAGGLIGGLCVWFYWRRARKN